MMERQMIPGLPVEYRTEEMLFSAWALAQPRNHKVPGDRVSVLETNGDGVHRENVEASRIQR